MPKTSTGQAPLYLDHNATTPVAAEVREAMLPFLGPLFGNPSSGHSFGRAAQAAIARARGQVAALIGATADDIVFTSGGTEASNLAILGTAALCDVPGHVVTTEIEHPATAVPCEWLERRGWRVTRVGVDGHGVARLDTASESLSDQTVLVTVMHSHNETGALQPVSYIAQAARARSPNVRVHVDAAQSVGKVAVDVDELGADLLTIAGHKLYAPKGIGALYVRDGVTLEPLLGGGGQERGLRSGTENVAGIVGLGAACALASSMLDDEGRRQRDLSDRLWTRLRDAVPGVRRFGPDRARLPNTCFVAFPDVGGPSLLEAAPEIAASTGSACHTSGERTSAVLLAMGVAAEDARGVVRLSLGRSTREEDVDAAVEALAAAWNRLRGEA